MTTDLHNVLTWEGPDDRGVLRAHDDRGLYVIAKEPAGTFRIGYFPSPGPECEWASGLDSLEEAKREAEACRRHNHEMYSKLGFDKV